MENPKGFNSISFSWFLNRRVFKPYHGDVKLQRRNFDLINSIQQPSIQYPHFTTKSRGHHCCWSKCTKKNAILISLVLDSFQHSLFILRHMIFELLFTQHVKNRSWGTIEFCFESVKVIKVITQQHIFPVSIFQSHLEMKPRGNYQGCLLLWSKRG